MEANNKKDSIMKLAKSPYIRSFIKKYKVNYILGVFCLIIIDYLQTKIPLITGDLIDGLVNQNITALNIRESLIYIGILATIIIIGRILWRLFIFGTARKVERDIRNDIFAHLEKLSQKYYNNHKTGEIMAYITNDLEAVRQAMGQGVLMIFDVIFLLFFTLYNMFLKINVGLTIGAVIPLFLIALTTSLLGPKIFRRFADRQEAFANVSDFVQENFSGIKVIKAFVQQNKEIEAFKKENNNYFKSNMNLMKLQAGMHPIMNAISGFAMAVAISFGGYLTVNNIIDVGSFTAFIEYLGMLVWPMMAIGISINILTMGSASLERIESVLNQNVDIKDMDNVKPLDKFSGDIKFEHLYYKYPNEEESNKENLDDNNLNKDDYVLKDISFEIKKGETLGIVGRTGSGKTTLVNLLLRIYDAKRNSIYISGRDILDIPLKTLRENIGYVPQDNFLFSDTIKNNIDFSDGTLSDKEIYDAAEFACVHDNIVDFKDGYDTIVGERGVTLSGGQKQRVSIARALIKKPEILILDDSVSAVDTDTEEKILHNLKELRKGKTNIIIAHRISTIQNSNLIIVIDNGKIVEMGTHRQLVEKNGLYNSLYQKQLLEKMIDEEK